MATLSLCNNCLEGGATGVPVGHAIGSQRDPVRIYTSLCPTCRKALLDSDWGLLSRRYAAERTIYQTLPNE